MRLILCCSFWKKLSTTVDISLQPSNNTPPVVTLSFSFCWVAFDNLFLHAGHHLAASSSVLFILLCRGWRLMMFCNLDFVATC